MNKTLAALFLSSTTILAGCSAVMFKPEGSLSENLLNISETSHHCEFTDRNELNIVSNDGKPETYDSKLYTSEDNSINLYFTYIGKDRPAEAVLSPDYDKKTCKIYGVPTILPLITP